MDRTLQPPFLKSLDFNLPVPERTQITDFCEIVYFPSDLSEAIKIEFIFKAGQYFEPNPGVAHFCTQLLSKGVPGKDANEIANQLDYYGTHLNLSTGPDFSSITLFALKKNIKHLLPLLFSIVRQPLFPETELIKFKQIFSENLKVNLEKNAYIAHNQISKMIFGNHPYGNSISSEDVNQIEASLLNSFFKSHFHPYKVFIVGALEKKDFEFLQESVPNSIPPSNSRRIAVTPQKASQEIIVGPNQVQASIKLGTQTISRTHQDAVHLKLINHLLGGFFGSRLMKNIREEKGLSYGIHSSIHNMLASSSLVISAEVNAENAEMALSEIKKELTLIQNTTETELAIAKNHLIGSIQNDITSIFSASDRIKSLILSDLPKEYYQNLLQQLASITSEDIKSTAALYFNPESFSYVMVK